MTKNLTEFEDWYLNKKGGKLMDKKKRAVRHKTSEWIRITLRVDPDNKNYIEDLCDNLGISQNLLINKIIDCFKEIDRAGKKTLGTNMIKSSLRKDSNKYDVSKNTIEIQLEQIKEGMVWIKNF